MIRSAELKRVWVLIELPKAIVKNLIISLTFLLLGGVPVFARVFTSRNGRTMEARFVEATELEVVVKLIKSGKVHRLQIATLSDADVDYVAMKRAAMNDLAKRKAEEGARLAEMERGARQVVEFVLKNKGRKIGDGECWTLADEAFKAAGIKRPGKNWRVWGGVVNWTVEEVLPGDILELRAAKFSNGQHSGPKHTAVVVKKSRRRGELMVAHQNWGIPGKKVSILTLHLAQLEEGEATIFRYGRK